MNTETKGSSDIKQEITNNNPITEKYWKLKTLSGKDIKMDEKQEREIYFTLKSDENRVVGFAGCNNFSGTFTIEEGNRIRFKQIFSTLKACPDLNINESEFLKIFNLVDNYTINGDTLNLNIGKRAPLAVFEAVYF
ncbi:META domain-containing protein [Lutibacter sp. A80]|uniref:META domain-containing protein n=1 Tax=Lutibacter sp. A80 TaxID=2918453 RepID=UPI001F0632A7|nr:META domain-containing protein [Lutibacter sp. A80]UMB59865.1 META domain-containing protein [Lutibacter sp. A80]